MTLEEMRQRDLEVYSLLGRPEDYWWMYTAIRETDGRRFKEVSFQIDKYGHVRIEEKDAVYPLAHGYKEITRAEYLEARNMLLSAVDRLIAD